MPSYTWKNKDTDELVELTALIKDRDIPPELPGEWERVLQMPAFKRVSYMDGQRGTGHSAEEKGHAAVKQASKLRVDLAQADPDSQERKEIQTAVNRLEKI